MSIGIPFVEYHVTINPYKLEISVKMHLRGLPTDNMRLEIPSWVPGDYSFAAYARDIFDVHAELTVTKEKIPVKRDGYCAYILEAGHADVTVTYKSYAYAIEFGDAAGILDSQYGILLGTHYLHSPDYLGPCMVHYEDLPNGWKIHHPAGAKREQNRNTWTYPGFEILLDSPVVFGHFDLLKRKVEGTDFYFVFVDRGVGYESEVNRFVDSLCDVANKMHAIFKSFPFENYTFIMSLNPTADWGLEHLTSTMCGLGPDVFIDDDQFSNGIRVCAHELFHAWNVRRLRPSPLDQLKHTLTKGCYSEGLWMAEGFTRYYEFLISTRVKAYTPDQFFSAVVGYFEHLSIQPAYQRVTAIDSSLATYLNHNKYSGRVNNSIDYYDKGMLIAFELDVALRLTGTGSSLDKAFEQFYREYVHGSPSYAGYTTKDVIDFFTHIVPEIGERLGNAISLPKCLNTIEYLRAIGFDVVVDGRYYLGIAFLNDGAPTIYNILDDSPAGSTGLAPDDVITHINGFKYSQAALSWVASHELAVDLTVQRGHRQLVFSATPTKRNKIMSLVWQGDADQSKLVSTWLHWEDFKPKKGTRVNLDFYENFHGVECVV